MPDFSNYERTRFTFEALDENDCSVRVSVVGLTAEGVLEEARDEFEHEEGFDDRDSITIENIVETDKVIDSAAFFEHYKPIENGDGEQMFETFAPDYDAVQAADPKTVWTLIDAEGSLYITAGWHFVNRIGYYIASVPRTEESEEQLEFFDC